MKTFDFGQCLPLLTRGRTVIEGRGLDSTAVYQSLIAYPYDIERAHAEARAILVIAAQWRPLPDLTILIDDDVTTAIGRAEQRDGRRFTPEQVSIHHQAARLFSLLAADYPDRFEVIDRRTTGIRQAQAQCTAWITGPAIARTPTSRPGRYGLGELGRADWLPYRLTVRRAAWLGARQVIDFGEHVLGQQARILDDARMLGQLGRSQPRHLVCRWARGNAVGDRHVDEIHVDMWARLMPVRRHPHLQDPPRNRDRDVWCTRRQRHRQRQQQAGREPGLLAHLAQHGLSGSLIGLHMTPRREQHLQPRVHDQAEPLPLSELGEDQRARRRLFLHRRRRHRLPFRRRDPIIAHLKIRHT